MQSDDERDKMPEERIEETSKRSRRDGRDNERVLTAEAADAAAGRANNREAESDKDSSSSSSVSAPSSHPIGRREAEREMAFHQQEGRRSFLRQMSAHFGSH